MQMPTGNCDWDLKGYRCFPGILARNVIHSIFPNRANVCPLLLGQDTEGEPASTNRMISFVFFLPFFLVRILQHTLTQHARQKETLSIALFFIIITVDLVPSR